MIRLWLLEESMSEISLFRISDTEVTELEGSSYSIEKSLQTLIEKNLDTFLGVRFLASEYTTGKTHGGRIDTLGIDENRCPVIIEYKRASNANVINQGLFYLDWLMDHKAEFALLVMKQIGKEVADTIEWSMPRLLCIAGDFTKYDEHAVSQIDRNIELIRYRRFGDELLLFELVNVVEATTPLSHTNEQRKKTGDDKTVADNLAQSKQDIRDRFESLKEYLLALGEDVQMKQLKQYFAFKRMKNFACVEVYPQAMKILVFIKVDPDTVSLAAGFTRDVRNIGHFGTGDLEITIKNNGDLELAKPLIERSYDAS
jgi:predicted transport protein